MRLFGVELAPAFVPWERRLQTLAVAHYVWLFVGPYFLVIACAIILPVFRLWWLALLYMLWLYMDRETPKRGSRPTAWARNWVLFKYMRDYFPISLIKTAELKSDVNYLIGYHPHGIMSFGAFCNFCTEATNFSQMFPGIKPYLCTLVGQFWFPFRREYLTLFGVVEVSKDSIRWLLSRKERGYAAVVVVGGAREALMAHPGTHRVTLLRRKGFIECAIQTGAHLVPVYSFGENDVYNRFESPDDSIRPNWQLSIKNYFGWTLPIICGRGLFNYSFGLLPHRRPIHTVIGKPIPVQQNDNPSEEEVEALRQIYVQGLRELFDENKARFSGYENKCQLNYFCAHAGWSTSLYNMVIKVCNNQEELDQALNDKNKIKVLTIFDKKHENHAACLRTMQELNDRCEEACFLPLDSNQFQSVVEREYFDRNRPIFVVYVGTERVCRAEYTRPKTVERTIQAWTRMKSAKAKNGRKDPDCPDNGGSPFSSY